MMKRNAIQKIMTVLLGAWIAACTPTLGSLGGPSPFELGPQLTLNSDATTAAESPDVAWNGEDFLVVWNARHVNGIDIFATRISPNGDVVGSLQTVSGAPGDQRRPSVAWGGNYFLVVWEDYQGSENSVVFGAWIDAGGDVLAVNGFRLAGGRYPQSSPRAVWTGREFLVTWIEQVGGGSGAEFYGTLVQPAVSIPVPQGRPIVIAPGDQSDQWPTWHEADGLLVWSDLRSGGSGDQASDLYAVMLDADGRRLSQNDLLVSEATDGQRLPAVAWDGSRFALLWVDRREGLDLIYGARIGGRGRLLDPSGVRIARGVAPVGPPTLLAMPSGELVGLWTELGQGQHLLVGQVWDQGFAGPGPDPEAPLEQAPPGRQGALAYVQAELPQRVRAAATSRGEILIVWTGKRTVTDLDTRIMALLVTIKRPTP